ncbi:MAG: hypothetical protein ACR2K2_04280 [Mycobacteriales bacterium]
MKTPSRWLGALLCVAVVGVLLAAGLLVAVAAGTVAVLGYAAVVGLLLGVAVVRGRHLLSPPPLPAGRTCTCCTATQHDPVRIL